MNSPQRRVVLVASGSRLRRAVLAIAVCSAVALGALPGRADEVDAAEVEVPSASAADQPAPETTSDSETDQWRFTVAPYAWFPFIVGTNTFNDQGNNISIKFSQLWNQLHMALFLDAEVQKGKFGLLTDLFYSYLWNRTQAGLQTYESDIRLVIFDFALFYEVWSMELGSGPKPSKLRLQPFFGGRYIYASVPTTVRPAGYRLDPVSNIAAPILGLRGYLDIDDHWNMSLYGDGGGWGVDDMKLTWQAEFLAGYRWHFDWTDFNLMVGYKALAVDSENELDTDVILHGPVLKLGFEF